MRQLFFTDSNGGDDPTLANPLSHNYAPLQQLFVDLADNTVAVHHRTHGGPSGPQWTLAAHLPDGACCPQTAQLLDTARAVAKFHLPMRLPRSLR